MIFTPKTVVTLEDCIKNYTVKGETVVLSNGMIVDFEDRLGRKSEDNQEISKVLINLKMPSQLQLKKGTNKNIHLNCSTGKEHWQWQNFGLVAMVLTMIWVRDVIVQGNIKKKKRRCPCCSVREQTGRWR